MTNKTLGKPKIIGLAPQWLQEFEQEAGYGKKKIKVIYIASPYRSDSENGVFENIVKARAVAVKLWAEGFAVICPHTNSFFMGSRLGDSSFLEGDLEIVRRCDIILRLPGESVGADNEVALAKSLGIKVYYNINDIPKLE